MPRAFLITHRRYNGVEDELEGSEERDFSTESGARQLAVYSGGCQPTSDGASECGSETSSECPEELYNLTKLAEVSLAAAAGTLIHRNNVIYQRPVSPRIAQHTNKGRTSRSAIATDIQDLGERRLLLERIETERESLDDRIDQDTNAGLGIRLPPRRLSPCSREELGSLTGALTPVVSGVDGSTSVTTAPPGASSQASRRATAAAESKPDDSEDHECPDCGKKYSTSSNLARHRQTHRSLGDKKARRCPHCDKVYVSMPAFSMHVRTHNQGCKCHYCGKCFSRPWLLQGHIRTHTGEKPFKCTICNKAFADKSNLRAHIQTHSNTKPHVCGRCGKAFALKSYLYKHEESSCMRAHHRSSTEKSPDQIEQQKPPLLKPSAPLPSSNRPQTTSTCVTASPTSVIVPRLGLEHESQKDTSTTSSSLSSSSSSSSSSSLSSSTSSSSSAFSAIIRHTRTTDATSSVRSMASKRSCRDGTLCSDDRQKQSPDPASKDPEYVSRMVIRTSVISPNPEHLLRFESDVKSPPTTFDYPDPTKPSAFSRPTTMTLNLALA